MEYHAAQVITLLQGSFYGAHHYMAGQKWGTQRYLSMRQEEFDE